MNPHRFDAVTKPFADRRLSRRTAVGASLAAGAAAMTGMGATAAQDATPAATPEAVAVPSMDQPPAQLFVQSFQSGSIAPSVSEFGTHTVTLAQGLDQTIVFTDRPSREVFTAPTPAFLDGLGFDADNPPNAAIVIDAGDGTTDIAVVELFNPSYDEATHTATYDISVLANWQNDLELGFQEAPIDLSDVSDTFGATHLFIDDCPEVTMACKQGGTVVGLISGLYRSIQSSEGTCELVPPADIPDFGRVGYCNLHFEACAIRCDGFEIWD